MIKIRRCNLSELPEKYYYREYMSTAVNPVGWLAYVDGELAGYCFLMEIDEFYKKLDDGKSLWCGPAQVFDENESESGKSYRGLGIQRKMISVRKKWAKRKGLNLLTCAAKNNIYSIRNILKMGFKKIKFDSDYYFFYRWKL